MTLVGDTPYADLQGTTTLTFDPDSGEAFFPSLAISGVGAYYIEINVTTTPAGYSMTEYLKVMVINPDHVGMVPEESFTMEVNIVKCVILYGLLRTHVV